MRKGQEVSRGRGWHRLQTVVCAGLVALACSGPFCKAGRAEAGEAAISGPEAFEVQPSGSDRAERPGQGGSKAAKTDQFRLNQETYEKAVAYSRTWYRLYFVSVAWGIAALVLLLRLGVAAKLRDFAERQSRSRGIQAAIFVPALLLLLAVLRLPAGIYWHRLSLRYQQSVQGWGSWFWDWTKEELLSVGLGFVVALILFAVIRWKPRMWWLY